LDLDVSSATLAGGDSGRPLSLTSIANARRGVSQLPVPLTPLIGRRNEQAAVSTLLRDYNVRLLTLTGPGGSGKTRLAIQVASEQARAFVDGIVFVALAPVTTPSDVLPAIARVLAVRESSGETLTERVEAVLGGRQLLLVLDNFEHVIAAAPRVTELLGRCPNLTVLVTSRVVLRVQGEQEFPVPPLSLPARGRGTTWSIPPLDELAGYDAIALFVQRARSIQPSFVLTDANALAVIEICQRLDGLPLAIELAAARINVLTPQALLTRLVNRLHVLTGGTRDQPARLQTMRTAIAWSYDLLHPAEQMLFRRLAVFVGGFTLDAGEAMAEAIAGIDALDGIATLVDSSLLGKGEDDGGEPRLLMLETIREYGLEQLALGGEEEGARRRHACWYLALAEQADPELTSPDEVWWLERLEVEHDNLRDALLWLLDCGEVESALRLVAAAWQFWFFRSHFSSLRGLVERALAREEAVSPAVRARALIVASIFAQGQADYEHAHLRLQESIALSRLAGDSRSYGLAILAMADVAHEQGDEERAIALFEEAVTRLDEVNEHAWLAVALASLGRMRYLNGEGDRALVLIEEALALSRNVGFVWATGLALGFLGGIRLDRREYARAAEYYRESLAVWVMLRDRWRIARTLARWAVIATENGQLEQATRLYAAGNAVHGDAVHEISLLAWMRKERVGYDEALTWLRDQLGALAFEAAWDAGRALSIDDAVAEALVVEVPSSVPDPDRPSPQAGERMGLSPRELEVLRLLVAGHTDRQIADALFISHRTAQGHVAGIFNKLGVNSRTAAATAAIRDGLVSPEAIPPA
jgi:non-specific serine/threonine protein kinase